MTNEEIDPLVPEMPRLTTDAHVVADGGRPSGDDGPTADDPVVDAPVVPEF